MLDNGIHFFLVALSFLTVNKDGEHKMIDDDDDDEQ
jgi:hypothetical protein